MAKQIRGLNAKTCGELRDFKIGNPTNLAFNPGDNVAAYVPSLQLELRDKLRLGEPSLGAQLPHNWADNISRRFQPLDSGKIYENISAEFHTT